MTLLLVLFCLATFIVSGFSGAIWVPAFASDTNHVVEKLELGPGVKVMEFGCGDGRFLRNAAKHGATAVGYEINPFLAKLAWLLSRGTGVEVHRANAWKKSFNSADVVFAFIMPQFMERLGAKLASELDPKATIVTYVYPIPNMQHYRYEHNCYFYHVC